MLWEHRTKSDKFWLLVIVQKLNIFCRKMALHANRVMVFMFREEYCRKSTKISRLKKAWSLEEEMLFTHQVRCDKG